MLVRKICIISFLSFIPLVQGMDDNFISPIKKRNRILWFLTKQRPTDTQSETGTFYDESFATYDTSTISSKSTFRRKITKTTYNDSKVPTKNHSSCPNYFEENSFLRKYDFLFDVHKHISWQKIVDYQIFLQDLGNWLLAKGLSIEKVESIIRPELPFNYLENCPVDFLDAEKYTLAEVLLERSHKCINYGFVAYPKLVKIGNIDTAQYQIAQYQYSHIPLEKATHPGFFDIFYWLIKSGKVDINYQNYRDGRTFLHMLVALGNARAVFDLLEQPSIEINLRDHDGLRPLDIACMNRKINIPDYFKYKDFLKHAKTEEDRKNISPEEWEKNKFFVETADQIEIIRRQFNAIEEISQACMSILVAFGKHQGSLETLGKQQLKPITRSASDETTKMSALKNSLKKITRISSI